MLGSECDGASQVCETDPDCEKAHQGLLMYEYSTMCKQFYIVG